MEILKDENPNLKEIFRRILISILLLYTFSWAVDAIATIGDAVTAKINGLEKLSEVFSKTRSELFRPRQLVQYAGNCNLRFLVLRLTS
jgi:hypothetical protein